jgi:UDP-glucose 4-epimerase
MQRRDEAPDPTTMNGSPAPRTVWVSGSSGKLGSEVVRQLREAGDHVIEADLVGESPVDLLDPAAVAESMRGAVAVIHCAAIPAPVNIEPADLMRINTLATFNALEQAWLAGIGTAAVASSASIYGPAWSDEWTSPALRFESVPVDEDTPLTFVDPYALSKDVTEGTCRMFARRGMTVTALRFHWIASVEQARERVATEPEAEGAVGLWGYTELGDAARACILSLGPLAAHRGYEALVIVADDTLSEVPTEDLLDRHLPNITRRRTIPGMGSAFDSSRAAEVIGWRPQHSWR